MANTDITLINDEGIYIASLPSVAVVSGETVTFATSDGSAVSLFFSPAAAKVLSPEPGSTFALATGARAVFTFTSSSPGAYSVYVGVAGSFPSAVSQELVIEIGPIGGSGPGFNSPADTLKKGHSTS